MSAATIDPESHVLTIAPPTWQALLALVRSDAPPQGECLDELTANRVAMGGEMDARIVPHLTARLDATHRYTLEEASGHTTIWCGSAGYTTCRPRGESELEVSWAHAGRWSLLAAALVDLAPRPPHSADTRSVDLTAPDLAIALADGSAPFGRLNRHWKLVGQPLDGEGAVSSLEVVDTERGMWFVETATSPRVLLVPASAIDVWLALIRFAPGNDRA